MSQKYLRFQSKLFLVKPVAGNPLSRTDVLPILASIVLGPVSVNVGVVLLEAGMVVELSLKGLFLVRPSFWYRSLVQEW